MHSSNTYTSFVGKNNEVIPLNLRTSIVYNYFITNTNPNKDLSRQQPQNIKVKISLMEWITLYEHPLDFESDKRFVLSLFVLLLNKNLLC